MKSSTLIANGIGLEGPATSATDTLRGHLSNVIAGWRRAAAERRMRADLSELDAHLLRDIGVADDEIGRVRACEPFTPRAWRN